MKQNTVHWIPRWKSYPFNHLDQNTNKYEPVTKTASLHFMRASQNGNSATLAFGHYFTALHVALSPFPFMLDRKEDHLHVNYTLFNFISITSLSMYINKHRIVIVKEQSANFLGLVTRSKLRRRVTFYCKSVPYSQTLFAEMQ